MPYKEPKFTATKRIKESTWYVKCARHGDFENNEGRCYICDEESANYVDPED